VAKENSRISISELSKREKKAFMKQKNGGEKRKSQGNRNPNLGIWETDPRSQRKVILPRGYHPKQPSKGKGRAVRESGGHSRSKNRGRTYWKTSPRAQETTGVQTARYQIDETNKTRKKEGGGLEKVKPTLGRSPSSAREKVGDLRGDTSHL